MKILHTGDWHLDIANLSYTVPALEAGFAAAAGRYDSLVHAGDLVIHNSSVHPDVAYRVRELLLGAADKARCASFVLAGNHDQSFHADRVGMVEGIFGRHERFERLFLESQMRVGLLAEGVALVAVPTPNKYWARARAAEGSDITELLASGVRGLIVMGRERVGAAGRVVVLYHGTIGGATLGDERQMPSGVDITLPREAFAGSDIVLAGHIHHRQEIPATAIAPPILYCGAPAPLTWNDRKLEPGMWLVDVSPAGVSWELIPLPVISQLLQIDMDAAPEADVNAAIREVVTARAGAGDRVRVCVHALGAVLDTISTDQRRALEADIGLQSLAVNGERTDTAAARMHIEMSASVVDALGQWAALKKIDGPTLEKLIALANEVESAAAADHIDARYELEPLSLRVENWRQYVDSSIDFTRLNGMIVVEGRNNTGKSNLLRSIPWALYKLQIACNKLDNLIRKGADWMRVTFEFMSGGHHYRIIREAKRGARGASAALHLQEVLPDGSAMPLAEGNARETQAAIEKLVGPVDLFLATTFAGQQEVDSLLDLTPGEMKDLLMQILQRDFGARHTAGRTEWNAAKTTEAAAIASAKAIRDALPVVDEGALPTLRATLTEHEGDVVTRRAAVTERMRELAEARSALGTVEAAEAEAADAARALDEWRERGKARAAALASTQDQLGAVNARLANVPAAPAPTSAELRASRLEAAAAAEAADAALVAAANAAAAATAPLDAHRQTCRDDQQIALAARGLAASRLADARTAAGLIDGVPCQGEVVQFVDYATRADESADCSKCQFLTRAAAARDQIAALEQALVDADARIAAAEAAYPVAVTASDEARDAANAARRAVEEHRARANAADRAAADAVHAAFNVEQAIVAAEADRVRVGELERAIFEHEGLAAEVQAEIDRLTVKAASFGDRLKHAETVRQAEHVAATRLAEEEGQLATLERMVTTTRGSIASIEAAVEQAKAGETKAAAWDATAAAAAERATVCALYADAMHRDGIPFLLLEQYSIPMLQTVTNEYLRGTGLSLAVEAERELQTGETRNAVEITYSDHRGSFPVSSASGALRFSIGSSLRHGMAELLARGTGSNIWLAVQDEGFGTLDPDNLEIAKTTLRNIAARRGRFIVISHVPGMSDVADHVLRVVDDGGTSRLEVM